MAMTLKELSAETVPYRSRTAASRSRRGLG